MEEILVPSDWRNSKAIIKVIGVGGGGGNAVNNMFTAGIEGVTFVTCNTDRQALDKSPISAKVQLGNKGLGAGCDPEKGKQAALESIDAIRQVLDDNTEMVFVTAGMGGGTGTGAAPVIAKTAKEMGILTVAIVTIPFRYEGRDFMKRAREGVVELQRYVDSMLVINNERLSEIYGNLSVFKAFSKADEVLTIAAKSIAEIITTSGEINVDFADVRKAMENSSVALMGSGMASGDDRALKAVEDALASPLLNNNDIAGAKNVLVNITAGDDFQMEEMQYIMDYVQQRTGGKSEFIKRGLVKDDSLDGAVKVTVVATGFGARVLPFDVYSDNEDVDEPPVRIALKDPAYHATDAGEKEIVFETLSEENNSDAAFAVDERRRVLIVHNDEQTAAPAAHPAKPQAKPVLIIDDESNVKELHGVPAYVRRKAPVDAAQTAAVAESQLEMSPSGAYRLDTNNTFLNQTMD
ncbi:MAG: cell division protein FtsZ [Prevotellaceae bacterium]|jgi:cell division protein FtsZ|nr:cell division protein FtsZ [Prevotellaceae bacterium]